MKERFKGAAVRRPQKNRLIQEFVHDAYRSRGKLPEPTVCQQCGAVFHKGHWTWAERPAGAHQEMCPACQQIRDRFPGGSVTLSGPFLGAHREEILNVARNEEAAAKAEHPLRRIMSIEEHPDRIVITTTDTHVPRRIGEALRSAYGGTLDLRYADEDRFIRVSWMR